MKTHRNTFLLFTLLFAAALPVAGFADEVTAERIPNTGPSGGEETLKEKAAHAWDRAGEATEKGWDKTKEISGEGWDKTKEFSAETWDKTKEVSGEAWDKTKDVSGEAWDKTKEATEDATDYAKGKMQSTPADGSGVAVEEKSVTE
ncbi:MAG: endoglucanase [Pseudomonadota bacterium]|nr:endoglucanase [Pseudomonadota bacterium]